MPETAPDKKSVFANALERPAAERVAYLDAACAGHPALRAEVEELLRAHAGAGSFMTAAPPAPGAATLSAPGRDPEPTRSHPSEVERSGAVVAGRYKLLQQIGEGGMGTVWMADQTEPVKRRVAVKLIRAERGASKTILSRFEAERQAIALMTHPNIARLLDAGTTEDGQPYFVMELVKGVPLTEFCDAHKLSVPDRLDLFRQICSAVHHAHQKGIIHRDLKPTNILVESHDGKPVPKVIDFGLAKATTGMQLTEHTLFTAFGTVAGTPLYMAPEQATFNAIDVDSRADIYALGVILYELLCGTTPLSKESLKSVALDEVLRTIREQEPPPPSSRISTSDARPVIAANRGSEAAKLGRFVKGELDWIVMKALSKERERRYESAPALAADVERFLNQEPVLAGPPSQWYRLRKFVRRNKAQVAAVSAVLLALVAGIAGTSLGLVRAIQAEGTAREEQAKANAERGRADEEAQRANEEARKVRAAQESQQASQYLSDMQLVPLAFEKGTTAEVRRLLDRHVPEPGATDRRCFEWFYWDRQLNLQIRAQQLPHGEDSIYSAWGVSDDGTRLACLTPPARGETDGSPVLTVWDTTTRAVLCRYVMPVKVPADQPSGSSPVGNRPRFSADGRRVEVEWSYAVSNRVQAGEKIGPGGPLARRTVAFLRQVVDVSTSKAILDVPGTGLFTGGGVFSRDGRRFATITHATAAGGWNPLGFSIMVWDLESGKEITDPAASSRTYAQVVFGPDGNTFLTADSVEPLTGLAAVAGGVALVPRARFSVRDVATGKELFGWQVPGYLETLTISPDGNLVAGTIHDAAGAPVRTVRVWKVSSGEPVASWLPEGMTQVRDLSFSPDGARLEVRGSDGNPQFQGGAIGYSAILDLRTGNPLPTARLADGGPTTLGRLSPDGKRAARVNNINNTLEILDASTGKLLLTFRGPANPVVAYGFNPDSQRLWSVERGGLFKEWDLHPPRPVVMPFLGGDPLLAGEFGLSADGTRFAQLVCNGDVRGGTAEFAVRMRTAGGREGKLLTTKPRAFGPQEFSYTPRCGLSLSRDGRRALLTRTEVGNVKVGDVQPGKDQWTKFPPPDLTVWDTETGAELLHLPLKGQKLLAANPYSGHVGGISPDGRVVAVGIVPTNVGDPVTVRVFDVDTARERPSLTLPGAMSLLTAGISPDGSQLAGVALYEEKGKEWIAAKLVVWGASGGEPSVVVDLPGGASPALFGKGGMSFLFRARIVWSPDSSRFLLSYTARLDGSCTVRDAATGKAIVTVELPDAPAAGSLIVPSAVRWNPDGKRIAGYLPASGPTKPAEVKVWDAVTGKELVTLRQPSAGLSVGLGGGGGFDGPRSEERYLAFSADGHRLRLAEFGDSADVPRGPGPGGQRWPNAFIITTWDATPAGK